MKTSSKILWGTLGLVVLLNIVSLLYVRANLTEQDFKTDTSDWQTQVLETDNFSEVAVHVAADIYIEQSEKKFEMHGTEETLAIVEVNIENGKLVVKYKDRTSYSVNHNRMKLYISTDSLTHIEHSSAGSIESSGKLTFPDLSIYTSGANDANLEIETGDFSYTQSGAGRASIIGNAENASFINSGVGNMDATEFEVKNVQIQGSGVGSFEVFAIDQLNINLSGAGSVRYKGNPRLQQNISGVGSISSM